MSRVTKGRYRRGPYSQLQLDGKVCWFALPPTIGGDPRMFRASLLAFGDLFAPRVAALLVATMVLSLVTFCLIWWGIDWSLGFWLPEPGAWPAWLSWLESLLTFAGPWLGAVLTFAMAWFLFPLVASAFLALFLEPIAAAIEARHYPALGRAPGLPLVTTMLATLRLLALVVLCNVGLLAVLVAFPAAY